MKFKRRKETNVDNVRYFIYDGEYSGETESREVEPLMFDVTLNIFKWAAFDWVVNTYHGDGYKTKTLVFVGNGDE